MCPRQAKDVSIEGHPYPAYNGVYSHDSTHEGWPVLKNARGMYCYRYTPRDQWLISMYFTPDSNNCNAHVTASEGPLPVGVHTWRLAPSVLGTAGWEGRAVTVALVLP